MAANAFNARTFGRQKRSQPLAGDLFRIKTELHAILQQAL
jgi:hypothetical protein